MHYRHTFLAFRQLLARLRHVMSSEDDGQSRLSSIVSIIANDMAAEVCSVYVRRAGEVLELFATHGLLPTAVHVTRLRIGEGLVGDIAATGRPLALAEAQRHPSFVYRPETGEENYRSFLGVPILGRGRVLGVLAIQNKDQREYRDEEIEVLQTVAMVLAEMVGTGDLVAPHELSPTEGIALTSLRLEGVALTSGSGIGIAVQHSSRVPIRKVIVDDSRVEHERLRDAVAEMHGTLDDLFSTVRSPGERDYHDVLEAYRMIAADVGWLGRIGDAIDTGLTAEAAVQKVANEIHARLTEASDPYLRERVHDFEDLANRLIRHLTGADAVPEDTPKGKDVVLVARSMGPADLLNYNRQGLRGVVLEEGSPTTHASIVARALDIPMVGHARDALSRIDSGDVVIVDADHAQVFVRPSDDIQQAFVNSIILRNARRAAYVAARDQPAVTRDGVRISVEINAGLLVDLDHLAVYGADGVGLYRTEVPFMVRSEFPGVESQVSLYTRVLEQAQGKPVVFRTLDVGGDKILPYWERANEENPSMGWRAIRVSLDRPAMLRQQLRAMTRAAAGRDLSIMFPLLAHVQEFRFARKLLSRELARLEERGEPMPKSVRAGAMIEVPALLFQLEALLGVVDFLSVGTNDLLQFLFASDRSSARLAERYDPLSPVFLETLRGIIKQCDAASGPISVCGDMCGRPLEAMALIGVGLRTLSVPPTTVGSVKTTIREITLSNLEEYLRLICQSQEESIRNKLSTFARDHDVTI